MTLAKPTGIPLVEHVSNVQNELGRILAMRPFLHEKYRRLTNNDLTALCNQSVKWHDEGKKHKTWQEACVKDFEVYRSLKDKTKFRGENLRKAKLRHEMDSLVRTEKANLSSVVKVAIAAHHGKLSNGERDRWKKDDDGNFASLWNDFNNEQDIVCDPEEKFETTIRTRYEYAAVRALLQLADHRASAREEGEILPCFEPFIYTFPHTKPRGVQKVIKDLQDLPFAILRAPTGAGKTDASLLWAKHQIDSKRADRLIIAMPTRFTANSLAISVSNSLGSSGLYHSTSYYQRTKDRKLTDEQKKFITKEQELARLLNTPITVTTIDHLCMCLTATREEHHTTFFNLANSCLVIDEADFYDSLTQENIIVLLSVLRILEVPVLIMSATIPDALQSVYAKSGHFVEKIFDVAPTLVAEAELPTGTEKPRVTLGQRVSAEIAEDIEDLLKQALEQPTIIYANTVRRAQMYYWYLKQFTNDIIIYHSRFTEPDKAKKEEKLLAMMGKEGWENGKAHGIAVLTQIGEISVNISANCMISEWCPIDRLIQRIGRLARFEGIPEVGGGVLHLIEPLKNGTLYPAPYGSFQKKKDEEGWKPSVYLTATINKFVGNSYTKSELLKLVNEVYNSAPLITPEAEKNAYQFQNLIETNWLILPALESEEDDTDVQDWKSRDIGSQTTVYYHESAGFLTDEFSLSFKNWRERREFYVTNGINIPSWEIQKAYRDGKVEKSSFQIGEYDSECLWVIKDMKYYEPKGVGLCFDISTNDFGD